MPEIIQHEDFERAAKHVGYEEMTRRVISVASMVLAESDSTSEVQMDPLMLIGVSKKGWSRTLTESAVLPFSSDFLLMTHIEVKASITDVHKKKPLVPRALGKLSLGEHLETHMHLSMRPFVIDDESGERRDVITSADVHDSVWQSYHVRPHIDQLETAAEFLAEVIAFNDMDITDPVTRTLEEYRS